MKSADRRPDPEDTRHPSAPARGSRAPGPGPSAPARGSRGPAPRGDTQDRELLSFVADHRLVLERQLRALVGDDGERLAARLRTLVGRGYLSRGCVFGQFHYQIRRPGLVVLGSDLPVPRLTLAGYRHDVGVAWLWLAARRGTFGPLREILSERRLRSHDGVLERPAVPLGLRLGGRDGRVRERLHYPDLLLIDPCDRRLAVELELTGKGRERRELILAGYAADERIDAVLYVVEDDPRGRAIRRLVDGSARQMGLTDRVAVQMIRPIVLDPTPLSGRASGRSVGRGGRARPGDFDRRGGESTAQRELGR